MTLYFKIIVTSLLSVSENRSKDATKTLGKYKAIFDCMSCLSPSKLSLVICS